MADHSLSSPRGPVKTKLMVPPARGAWVTRPRLVEQLDELFSLKLGLISAPAGFGKTSLVSNWCARHKSKVAWLSLDAGDSDPARFWMYFLAALQTQAPDSLPDMNDLFESAPGDPGEPVLSVLVNALASLPRETVLVLDDYHLIETPSLHVGMNFLLDHLPPSLHLLVTTRADPPWSLARMRARGEMVELRAADLRFTTAEATAFLQGSMGLDLSPTQVAALETRTEGWIAGLQLAALRIRGHTDVDEFIRAFAGTNRYIMDYLMEEVLRGQTPEIYTFLCETSILDRVCASLCDAVTGRPGSAEILQSLERNNLFLVELDDDRIWHRYHQLFGDLLRTRLVEREPERMNELHRRASEWFERHDFVVEAINHALAGHDVERAARLIQAIGITQFGQLHIQQSLRKWLDALPAALFVNHPVLALISAWERFIARDVRTLGERLQQADRGAELVTGQMEAGPARNLSGMVRAMRAFLVAYSYDHDLAEVVAWGEQALENLDPGEFTFRGLASGALATAYLKQGDLARASQAYARACEMGRASRNVYVATGSLDHEISIVRLQGRWHEAVTLCRAGMEWMREHGAQSSPALGHLSRSLADLLREWNERDAALDCAVSSIAQSSRGSSPYLVATAYFARMRAEQAKNDWQAVSETFAVVSRLAEELEGTWPPALLPAFQAQCRVLRGELDAALGWAKDAPWCPDTLMPFLGVFELIQEYEHIRLARAQVYLACGRANHDPALVEKALAYLQGQQALAERVGLEWYRIKVIALRALGHDALGDSDAAMALLGQALVLAGPEGLVRIFADEGAPMQKLLARSRAQAEPVSASGLAYLDRLLAAFAPAVSSPASLPAKSVPPVSPRGVEPLSPRELEVLQLVAAGLTNREIAKKLVISPGTAKRHVNNIYARLQVGNRVQAVERARALGLF